MYTTVLTDPNRLSPATNRLNSTGFWCWVSQSIFMIGIRRGDLMYYAVPWDKSLIQSPVESSFVRYSGAKAINFFMRICKKYCEETTQNISRKHRIMCFLAKKALSMNFCDLWCDIYGIYIWQKPICINSKEIR